MKRVATCQRNTNETQISVELSFDGDGSAAVETGIGFLDHMLSALARHAQWNVNLRCKGDLLVDDHHTSEDVAIILGTTFDKALGARNGIARFGYAYAPR